MLAPCHILYHLSQCANQPWICQIEMHDPNFQISYNQAWLMTRVVDNLFYGPSTLGLYDSDAPPQETSIYSMALDCSTITLMDDFDGSRWRPLISIDLPSLYIRSRPHSVHENTQEWLASFSIVGQWFHLLHGDWRRLLGLSQVNNNQHTHQHTVDAPTIEKYHSAVRWLPATARLLLS